ncbi:MAG: mandelate racemase/muconate lactonizing enzyme family protein [Spirochaetaceae bacterium]|nr:MAG: mandelate racemase/muconate lactonizing enzyme family protein [Spirochaetaceae bacterium]
MMDGGHSLRISGLRTAVVQANFYWTYIRVYTREGGLYGTGEAFFAPGLQSIVQEFESILIGEDPTATEYLVERMRWAASGAGSLGGIIWNAITGIEAALLDLKGKIYGIPVYQLLGGKVNPVVPLYADCHGGHALEALNPLLQPVSPEWNGGSSSTTADAAAGGAAAGDDPAGMIRAARHRARTMVDQGFRILKFDLDIPGSTFDSAAGYSLTARDRELLLQLALQLREEVGPDVGLAFDAHWRYRTADILTLARDLESINPLWLEDPLPPQDTGGFARLRMQTAVPIATGENLQLRHGFAPYIEGQLCDVICPDVQKSGGLVETKYIAAWAVSRNLALAIHMIGSPLALAASTHLAVTLPNLIACEFHASDVPFFHDLVAEGTEEWFRPGEALVLDRPGFGVELNEKTLARYRVNGTQVF